MITVKAETFFLWFMTQWELCGVENGPMTFVAWVKGD